LNNMKNAQLMQVW